MQSPAEIPSNYSGSHEHFSFTDQQLLLDYYEHCLFTAFQQVEELKRITRSKKVMGSCLICSSSLNSRKPVVSTRPRSTSTDVFKKSRRGSHPLSTMQRSNVDEMGDMINEGQSTSDGLMMAVDKFLTGAEFRG